MCSQVNVLICRFVTVLFNSVFTIFWDFNIQCRVCYTACSVNRRETASLFKFPIKSLMIPFELNSLPALLPFGRSCYCSALCSLFLFFSQISLRFLLQQISTVLKQQFFGKKGLLPPTASSLHSRDDKYSCLHSNR